MTANLDPDLGNSLPHGFRWELEGGSEVLYDEDSAEVGCIAAANEGSWQAYRPDDEWPLSSHGTPGEARYAVECAAGVW